MKTLIITGLLATMSFARISAQTTEVLSGTLSTSKTLNASTCYELDGCYSVTSGGVLNIPAGTVIRAQSQSSLIIQRGGQIFASGTSSNPVVFTSAQPVSSRAAGDWDGIYIAGYAVNNQGTPTLTKSCPGSIIYGGVNNSDNSGTMQYVRIEYAGVAPVGDPEASALNLLSVGTATTIDHIQVSYSRKNAYDIRGGQAAFNYFESLNSYKADMQIREGYTGKIQFLTGIRLDPNAHDNTGVFSNGIFVLNDALGSTNTPITHPVISNATFFGPRYCGSTSIHSDFRAAVRLALNAQAEIYNSVFSGWATGLQIVDNSTIINANVNGTVGLEYNTFFNNPTPFANSPANFDPTGTGCASTITDWMDGSLACSMVDNFVRTSLTGYSSSICGNYCTTAPTMTLSGTNNVGSADYSWDVGSDFNPVTYRGSLTNTDWSVTWSNKCPQNVVYCSLSAMKAAPQESLKFAPNPASSSTAVTFHAEQTGKVRLSVLDKISGKLLISEEHIVDHTGAQRITIDASGLSEGVYFVQVQFPGGAVIAGHLSVQ